MGDSKTSDYILIFFIWFYMQNCNILVYSVYSCCMQLLYTQSAADLCRKTCYSLVLGRRIVKGGSSSCFLIFIRLSEFRKHVILPRILIFINGIFLLLAWISALTTTWFVSGRDVFSGLTCTSTSAPYWNSCPNYMTNTLV